MLATPNLSKNMSIIRATTALKNARALQHKLSCLCHSTCQQHSIELNYHHSITGSTQPCQLIEDTQAILLHIHKEPITAAALIITLKFTPPNIDDMLSFFDEIQADTKEHNFNLIQYRIIKGVTTLKLGQDLTQFIQNNQPKQNA